MAKRKISSDELRRDCTDLTTEDFAYAYASYYFEFESSIVEHHGFLVGYTKDNHLIIDVGPNLLDPNYDAYRNGWVFVQPVLKGRLLYVLGLWRDKLVGVYESEGALLTPVKKAISEYPHKCQRCGGPALELARTIDCPRGCWK